MNRAAHGALTGALSLIGLFLSPGETAAGGIQINAQSVTDLGRGFSAYGMAGDDASAVFYNPAGMTLLDDAQAQLGFFYLTTQAKFENRGSTQAITPPMGAPVSITSVGPDEDGGADGVVPAAYFSMPLTERASIGLGVTVPFGFKTDHDRDWVGRYHAKKSELLTVDVNPTIAYRLTDSFSIGAGLSAQYADATLSRALFLLDRNTLAQVPDGFAEVRADDWGWGFNLGVMYEYDAGTRIGVGFRSKIKQKLEGDRKISDAPGLDGKVDAKTSIDFPETLHVGAYRRLNPQWSLTVGARWTRWSRFDEVRISFSDGSPDETLTPNWEDSWTLSVGANYDYSSHWIFRIGYLYDESPIPNKRRRTPRIPDSDRHWAAIGATYRPTDALSLEIGYAHLFVEDAEVENTIDLDPTNPGLATDTLVGEYDSSRGDLVSAQLLYRF